MLEPKRRSYVLNPKPPKQLPVPLKSPVKKPQKQKKQDSKPRPDPPQKHPPEDEESSRTLPSQRHQHEVEEQHHSKRALFVVVVELDGELVHVGQRVQREVEVFEDGERW
jgi:hypothetical protein